MATVRLNKFLADAGICSRRKADEHISSGDVYVNGARATLGMKVDPENDQVVFRRTPVGQHPEKLVYYALYKPPGVVSTAADEKGRTAVTDLVPRHPRVYPVGRLDLTSAGLVILTNDGELAHQLMHPSFVHEKEYEVVVQAPAQVTADEIKRRFEQGLEIEGKLMQADRVSLLRRSPKRADIVTLQMVLHTGYNRQIRRMCVALGLTIVALLRTRMGKLNLSNLGLKPGQYRLVSKSDILESL